MTKQWNCSFKPIPRWTPFPIAPRISLCLFQNQLLAPVNYQCTQGNTTSNAVTFRGSALKNREWDHPGAFVALWAQYKASPGSVVRGGNRCSSFIGAIQHPIGSIATWLGGRPGRRNSFLSPSLCSARMSLCASKLAFTWC